MNKLDELVMFLKKPFYDTVMDNWSWADAGKKVLVDFLGSGERYRASTYDEDGKKLVAIRNPGTDMQQGIPYIAMVQPEANPSGSYDGTSLVFFPSKDGGSLLTLCIGTDGINADAEVLSRPGHARRLSAMADYLNKTYGGGKRVAWAKKDPCAIEQPMPDEFLNSVLNTTHGQSYEKAIGKQSSYNPLLYFVADINSMSDGGASEALVLLMDMMMELRGAAFLTAADANTNPMSRSKLEGKYLPYLFPDQSKDQVKKLLNERRFVIVQGPPGTGKTHLVVGDGGLMADYPDRGMSIQFHPNVTYENFIGGLFPVQDDTGMGFKFKAKPGVLMQCAKLAREKPDVLFLLHVDEINRADLSRVLGESIFLFEPKESREITLEHDYGQGYGDKLALPPNLHIIGTMNTADKSVAPIDIAIRRRFAFVDLYPQISVVEKMSKSQLAKQAFAGLLRLFVDYASEDSFKYLPGHSYFIAADDEMFKTRMRTEVIPLLNEYLEEGLVASMATYIVDYIQQYRNVCL